MRTRLAALVLIAALASVTRPAGAETGRPVTLPDGRVIHLICAGPERPGTPTVMLVSGYHDSADPWLDPAVLDLLPKAAGMPVLPALAADTRVCAYDRPGTLRYIEGVPLTERSTPVPQPRLLGDLAAELAAVLDAGDIHGPVVLVGHSLGGLLSLYFGRAYPERTAGIVFVDAFSPDVPGRLGALWPLYRAILNPPPGTAPLPALNRPDSESVDIDASIAALTELPPLPSMPLAVLTKTEPFRIPAEALPPGLTAPDIDGNYEAAQAAFVALAPTTPQFMATGSEHYIQLSQPDLVTAAVRLVLGRVAALAR